jgi:hypothetical protein
MLEIMKKLGCEKCILQDMAELKCTRRNRNNYDTSGNLNSSQVFALDVPLSLIHKLWKGTTYYEDFGFMPYNKNNNLHTNNLLLQINKKIKNLQNIKWDFFNNYNEDKKWNELKKKYSHVYPSPFTTFREFTPENCDLFYDILYLLDMDVDELSEIKRLISKSIWMKIL